MKKIFLLAMFLITAGTLRAATYNAASCSEADVQSAYNKEQLTPQDSDIISIPAGSGSTCTWTSTFTISPPNSLAFIGAGALIPDPACTFVPGTACTTTSGSDQTVLTFNVTGGTLLNVTITSGKTFRISGLEYNLPSGNPTSGSGGWYITSSGNGPANFRVDHCHFNGYQDHWIVVRGWIYGVADHNILDMFKTDPIWIDMNNGASWNNQETSTLLGNASWADSTFWGSEKFFFEENNVLESDQTITGSYMNDCSRGGRQVFRYNTLKGLAAIQAHEALQDARGCRATEVYGNTYTAISNGGNNAASSRSGSDLVWGNNGSWQNMYAMLIDRTSNVNGAFYGATLGMCGQGSSGTATSSGSTVTWVTGRDGGNGQIQFDTTWPNTSVPKMVFNGTSYSIASCSNATTCTLTGLTGSNPTAVSWYAPSLWDENTDSTGYACYDQSGRGKGDLITGSFLNVPIDRKDSVTGTVTWPNEALDPSYIFNNTNNWQGNTSNNLVGASNSFTQPLEVANREWYADQWTSTAQTSSTSPFNGTNISQPISSWTSNGTTLTITVPSTTGLAANQYVNVADAVMGASRAINNTYQISSVTATTVVVPYSFTDSGGAGGWVASLGVGVGTLANRPTTCGAGPGGNTPGVGYWATDKNTLYVCNPANTWTVYYTPFTYPHPLTGKSQVSVTGTAGAGRGWLTGKAVAQ